MVQDWQAKFDVVLNLILRLHWCAETLLPPGQTTCGTGPGLSLGNVTDSSPAPPTTVSRPHSYSLDIRGLARIEVTSG